MNSKALVRLLVNYMARVFGSENMLILETRFRFKKTIHIDKPITLSDKICYLEFRTDNPLTVMCSDKYEVRGYVKSKGLERLLVPLIGDVYDCVEQIDFQSLPEQFVLKATYGCQMNLICEDKSRLDIVKTKRVVKGWLSRGFNRDILEPHYRTIKRRIICEMFLEGSDGIIDYKIHCLNGAPIFILVCSERSKGLCLNLYDLQWNPIHEIIGKHLNNKEIQKPSGLDEMIEASKVLSEDFEFVRVDFYEINGNVYFGELTFTPDGGILSYFSKDFDQKMGAKLILKEIH